MRTTSLSRLSAIIILFAVETGLAAQRPAIAPLPDRQPKDAKPVKLPAPLPIDLSLFRPDSLAGWTHAATAPTGWSIEKGRLTARTGATPLLSGYALEDFELHFKYSVLDAATLTVELPQIPQGPVLSIAFEQTAECGRIQEDGNQLAAGRKIAAGDGPHSVVIKRANDELSVAVDGQPVSKFRVDAARRFGLGLSARGQVTAWEMRLREALGTPIFNGVDLTGWWCPGKSDAWQAIDKELVLAARGGNYLRTEELYGNFTLSLEYKIKKGGNSGIGIRTPRDGWPSGDGMELQILDHPGVDKGGMMSIYRNVPPLAVAHKSEQWNQIVIQAEGRIISAWVNGQLVQHVNTAFEPELKHRHLKGWIGFQDHGAKIQIRHLRITRAPKGLGLRAWYDPKPETPANFVLGRLLNTERLSRYDDSRGAILTATVGKKGEHTLADLKGPAALTRITSDDLSGEIAFHFDGEKKPRLKCKAGDLSRRLPRLPGVQGNTPVLTCVPFKKSLKIVLRKGGPATYRFEYVGLPQGVATETFSKTDAAIPKSLAAALDYRVHHHKHGVVRNHAPYLRVASDRKRLAPGKGAELVNVDGAGLVQWVQLRCPKRHWKTDDLWIEVTIDGESGPAISAPARYFFSGAAVAGRYANYVLTERGGPINRLAMPFGAGIRMSLSNRGEQPIDGVGLTASIQQAADKLEAKDFAGRMRLRGVFDRTDTEEPDHILFRRAGRGRWVALVCCTEQGPETALDVLRIDGRTPNGWQPTGLNELLGCPPKAGEFRGVLAGREGGLAWRYLLPEAIDFQQEIVAAVPQGTVVGGRLALFYLRNP